MLLSAFFLCSSSYNFMMVYPVKSGSELEPDFPNVACKQASKFSNFIFAMPAI